MCTSLIFSVLSAPGQGLISTLSSCLLFPYLFPISSPAWPRVSLFSFSFACPLCPFTHITHTVMFSTAPLFLFFFFSSSVSFCSNILSFAHWQSLRLSIYLPLTLPLSFVPRVIWGIYQQTWSRALLRSALLCVETLIRGIAWQCSPKPASFKSTDVLSHTNPLQVYRSFIDALLQSAQLPRISAQPSVTLSRTS